MAEENNYLHAREAFEGGDFVLARSRFAELLAGTESSALWNDWATTQIHCNELAEAEAGYLRALELDPEDGDAILNLAVLWAQTERWFEALPLLEKSQIKGRLGRPELLALLDEARKQRTEALPAADIENYLQKWMGPDRPEQEYFRTHAGRYAATLQMLPQATPGQKLLELGSSFHQLTPALAELKGYEVCGTDIWEGPNEAQHRISAGDGSVFTCMVSNFDLESAPWPYADETIDVILMCEILEHLARDPMLVMSEINRILRPGGLLLLTTPNIASAKSLAYAMLGKSPYVFGQYVPGGLSTDRHNREYTAAETAVLAEAAGFEVVKLRTHDSWWKTEGHVLAKLPAMNMPVALRGDNTLLLARKSGTIRNRYPEEFYCAEGSQAERRNSQERVCGHNVLIVHEVLPHFDRSGSDLRLLQIIKALRQTGNRVTVLGRNGLDKERYQPLLESLGVTVYAGDRDRMCAYGVEGDASWNFEDLLKAEDFDCAILFHWFWSGISTSEHYLNSIRECSPSTRVAILTDDRHGLREQRMAELTGFLGDRERAIGFSAREAEIYSRADLLLGISEDDLAGLQMLAPKTEIGLLPMAAEGGQPGSLWGERNHVVFLANFDNLANRDGIEWFLREVWPLVHRAEPGLELHLIGNNIPAGNKPPGVAVCGFVDDVNQALAEYRVFICPVRFGTGIKTKNLSAMASGVPIVTTTIGAEGMAIVDGETALIRDSAEAFAQAILQLHSEEHLWKSIAANAIRHLAAEFSEERLRAKLVEALGRLDRLAPKAYDSEFVPSVLEIERHFPDLLSQEPPESRVWQRLISYSKMAESHLANGEFAAGLDQLRHIFSFVRGEIPRTFFFARVLDLMERCYCGLGRLAEAACCNRESKLCFPELQLPEVQLKGVPRSAKRKILPELSVIIPTHNRQNTLASCLAALQAQSLPSGYFEVIVVDDGSSDGTERYVQSLNTDYSLRYIWQKNAGAGAARRKGVEKAGGKYLVLINDDTIADPQMLTEHLRVQRAYPQSRTAVLGNFRYPAEARRRALTAFLNARPFMFPQNAMQAGGYYNFNCFITCNLSVRRDLVVAVDSFDRELRVGEDTDLGFRLEVRAGLRVLYHPWADARHDHLDIGMAAMVARAKSYGPAYLRLFDKYPELLAAIRLPVAIEQMDEAAITRIREYLQEQRSQTEAAVQALAQYDELDFELLSEKKIGDTPARKAILDLFALAIPAVHWFYVLESLADTFERRLAKLPPASIIEFRAGAASVASRAIVGTH